MFYPKNHHNNQQSKLIDKLLTLPQYLIAQHRLSILMHRLSRCKVKWWKNLFIRIVCWKYNVDLTQAALTEPDDYKSFNDFFTRSLKPHARPLAVGEDVLVSPVDGTISQLGILDKGQIIQAKSRDYSVSKLLGGDGVLARQFEQGQFATIYLSPRDYHRIHMPLAGQLKTMRYIPGRLFSVSPHAVRTVADLFARNERLVTVFATALGPMIVVLVGAIFVGSMETVWQGQITPPYGKEIMDWDYSEQAISLQKGEEMGRFNMGSTVILLLSRQQSKFQSKWQAGSPVRMGQDMN